MSRPAVDRARAPRAASTRPGRTTGQLQSVGGERLDAEPLRHLLERYFAAMAAAIERHGGPVEKFIGDAVVGTFGVPVAHEDDAVRAVRTAFDTGIAFWA